jgi:hypothetical protein
VKVPFFAAVFLFSLAFLSAQEAAGASGEKLVSISQQLHSFSPLGAVYVRNLGLEDKNSNGVIDKGAGEGYEEFTARYGAADIGFAANGVTFGTNDGQLQEPEIINHYYINIRFKEPEVTETIENEVSAYIYANKLPLVWLDDEQGTVMNAVTRILGEGWNEQDVTEDEAIKMFYRVMDKMKTRGRSGKSINTGYYTLPELVTRKAGYCFELAQFQFWFFSQIKIPSTVVRARLGSAGTHEVIQYLTDNNKTRIDYFGSSKSYNLSDDDWTVINPVQLYSMYYTALAASEEKARRGYLMHREQAAIYDRNNVTRIAAMMDAITNNNRNDKEIIRLGCFILERINIDYLMNSENSVPREVVDNLQEVLLMLIESYSAVKDELGFQNVENILRQYYLKPGFRYTESELLAFIAFYKN